MSRDLSDVLRIFRLAIARRNENDPDSNDSTLLSYVNDFATLTMSDDVKLFEQWGTVSFTIDDTVADGVYEFPSNATSSGFTNITAEALISELDPQNNSVSWNVLDVYQDPGEFYGYWGINNYEVLTPGYPTQMLYYGNQFVFRTIPDREFLVNIYGYKINPEFSALGDAVPFDYWTRYLAYGAALNYAQDYSLDESRLAQIRRSFASERKLLLTRTHNQIKQSRCFPRF